MKTIQVSDEDYKTLMDLSKELQTQTNNHQAFPYFWEPASERRVYNMHDEGRLVSVISFGEQYDAKSLWENHEELAQKYLEEKELPEDTIFSEIEKYDWMNWACENDGYMEIYTEDWEQKTEHNPSLFLSDVENFIESNPHHLGKDPHTYSRSFFRMPKMEALITAVANLNKDHGEEINHEIKRFIK
jgi:signal-transduction protein with cAMP-binding, CBS, and nucleotidyltransferase domain